MKRKIIGFISLFVLIAIFSSGIIAQFMEFIAWLLLLQYSGPETSLFGEIVVRVLTFLTTYGLVGCIFDAFGWYNSRWMKAFYWIISTIVGFIVAWIVWFFETYLLIIGIVLGFVLVGTIAYFLISHLVKMRKTITPAEQIKE